MKPIEVVMQEQQGQQVLKVKLPLKISKELKPKPGKTSQNQ